MMVTEYTVWMYQKMIRVALALILVLASTGVGYTFGHTTTPSTESLSAASSLSTPPAAPPKKGSTRIIYSLDNKQVDQEIIALIRDAEKYIYFAIYTFTLPSIADALIEAKERGIDVRGLMDSTQSSNSYGAPITEKLLAAGIPLLVERHTSGNGIMHIKLLVTENAYAFGSYNWTRSATTINDEIIEIGTDPGLRQTFEDILKRLFSSYKGNAAAGAAARVSSGTYDYKDAPKHVGEYASVRGTLLRVYTSKSGTVFLDFCQNYKECPFTAVIFANDVKKFGTISSYVGSVVTLTGKISLYQGKAEIILSSPSQLSNK